MPAAIYFLEPAVGHREHQANEDPIDECADLSFAPRLACVRWHDDGACARVMIAGERSLPEAIAAHSSIKQERPCSIRAGNGRCLRLFRLGVLRVGGGRGQRQHKRDR